MTFEDRDDVLDERLRDLASGYHEPPEPPRELMWTAIVTRRAAARRIHVLRVRRAGTWGLAAAAVLVLGIALGRWSATRTPATSIPVARAPAPNPAPLQFAATQYLTRTEALLTSLRSGGAPLDDQFLDSARDLLAMTRLLLDSPLAAGDPALRELFSDLELVLAQVVQLSPVTPERAEMDLITEGLNERGVLARLRTAIPAGPAALGTQGAL